MLIKYENRNQLKKGMIIRFQLHPRTGVAKTYQDYLSNGEFRITTVTSYSFTFQMIDPPKEFDRGELPFTDSYGALQDSYDILVLSYEVLSNKGRTVCVECGCATEQRRNFATFEVHEMCPRCKL